MALGQQHGFYSFIRLWGANIWPGSPPAGRGAQGPCCHHVTELPWGGSTHLHHTPLLLVLPLEIARSGTLGGLVLCPSCFYPRVLQPSLCVVPRSVSRPLSPQVVPRGGQPGTCSTPGGVGGHAPFLKSTLCFHAHCVPCVAQELWLMTLWNLSVCPRAVTYSPLPPKQRN